MNMMGKGMQRNYVYIIIFLILLSTVFSVSPWIIHGKVKVGIILTEECEPRFGEYTREIFEEYGEFFSAKIIVERKNISALIPVNEHYLCEDFNDPNYSRMIRDKYDVDLIVVIITHYLMDEEKKPYILCGKADTKSSSAVMTVFKFNPDSEFVGTQEQRIKAERNFTQHVSLHEVGHLLGYKHEFFDDNCVMKYGGISSDLCFQHSFEMPYRTMANGMSSGMQNSWWIFLTSILLSLIFLPYLVAFVIIIHFLFLTHVYEKDRYPMQIIGLNSSFAFFILMISNSILIGIMVALLFTVSIEFYNYFWQQSRLNKRNEMEE